MQILIAHDEAFNFTYRANIDALRNMGEVIFFSPLHDNISIDCDLLYLPGGYPELFLEEIKANSIMLNRIRQYIESGGRTFAECGGFMYLCQDIDNIPMCGIFPLHASMDGARLHLGYREYNGMKGHEFHYSSVTSDQVQSDKLDLVSTHSKVEINNRHLKNLPLIHHYKNVIAGYTHWYWAETGFETLWKRLSKK